MPIPEPEKKEKEQQFISRCIETLAKKKADEFPASGQKAAVCYSQWRKDHTEQTDSTHKKGEQ